MACWHKSFWRSLPLPSLPLPYSHYPYHSLAKLQEGNTAPTHQQEIVLKIYWAWPFPSEHDQTPPQPVPSIKKFPQASYPYPSEGRQNENHNYKKLTKLITWITALSNSKQLWAILCSATQDGQVMLESSDKHDPLEKGMSNHFSILPLRTPWTVWKGKQEIYLKLTIGLYFIFSFIHFIFTLKLFLKMDF